MIKKQHFSWYNSSKAMAEHHNSKSNSDISRNRQKKYSEAKVDCFNTQRTVQQMFSFGYTPALPRGCAAFFKFFLIVLIQMKACLKTLGKN